jgi:hypothetical protein
MSLGTRGSSVLLAGLASGVTGGIGIGLVGLTQATCFGAGWVLALILLAGGSQHTPDGLHPARLQLARFRRSGMPADVLVVDLPPAPGIGRRRMSRKCASTVSSVLRVTDGVARVPSLGGHGFCAVLETEARTRIAIQRRLREACGCEIRTAWASSPDDGVTLESLIATAVDRLPQPRQRQRRQVMPPLPVQRLVPRSLGPERQPMGRAR